jgi:hypothetical protein
MRHRRLSKIKGVPVADADRPCFGHVTPMPAAYRLCTGDVPAMYRLYTGYAPC